MFVCVCTYHEPVAGYTYLNSLPVYKVIKNTFISYSQCVNKNKKNTLYFHLDSQKHKNTIAVCVPFIHWPLRTFYSGVAFFTLAPDVAIRIIVQDWRQICQITFFITGGSVGAHACAHMDKIYIYSGYFWDEESDFAIHFNLEPTVFALGGPEKVRPATENGAKRRLNVRISKLRHDH